MTEIYFLITGAAIAASVFFVLALLSENFRARMVIRSAGFEARARLAFLRARDEAKREYTDRTHRPVTTKSSDEIALFASKKFNNFLDEEYDGI